MIYLITDGSYSDYTIIATLEGPEDVDLLALQDDYFERTGDPEADDADGLVHRLITDHGFRTVFHTEYNSRQARGGVNDTMHPLWIRYPDDGRCPVLAGGLHQWYRRWDKETDRRYWSCWNCKEQREVDAPPLTPAELSAAIRPHRLPRK